MRIRTKLQSLVIMALLIAVMVFLSDYMAMRGIDEDISEMALYSELTNKVLALNTLGESYMRDPRERVKAQWESVYRTTGSLIEQIHPAQPHERLTIDSLWKDYWEVHSIFARLMEDEAMTELGPLSANVRQRSIGQLSVKLRVMADRVLQLLDARKEKIRATQRASGLTTMVLVTGLVLINSGVMLVILRRLSRSILDLSKATRRIAGGDLDYRTKVSGGDELGELARDFNGMAAHLKRSYEELEKEITERKRAEEALRESEVRYRTLFESIDEGFCIVEVLFDTMGKPVDYRFLETNPVFVEQTGLRDAVGKRMRELEPRHEEHWFETYGRIALTGKPERFTNEAKHLDNRWYDVYAFRVGRSEERKVAILFNDVTGRKRLEEERGQQNLVLGGINRILKETLTCDTEEALSRICLSVAEEVTESRFGFIGEINAQGMLDDIALSESAWSACRMKVPAGHHQLPTGFITHGLYGRVLLDGKGFFTNSPASHPDSIGLPEGHPPLKAFLGVPLIHEGRTIGMVACGNREGGYSLEHQQALEAIGPAIIEALMRKRSEKALRRSEERFRVAQELSLDAFTILDAVRDEQGVIIDFRWQYVNPEAGRILKHAPEELVGQRLLQVLPGNKSDSDLFDNYVRVVETGEPHDYELCYESEGIRGWFRNMTLKLGDGIAVSFSNITERKRSEEALRQARDELEDRVRERTAELEEAKEALQDQKALLETILEQAADAILVTDTSGARLFVNEAAKRMALRDWADHPLELVEAYWGKAYYPGGEPIPLEEWSIPKALRGETTASREARMVRPDGSYYDISISAAPLRKPDGTIFGAVSIFSDVTERKCSEAALRESEGRLRDLSSRLLSAQEEERKRIARELHDSIGASLSAIKMSLENLRGVIAGSSESARSIETLISLTQQTIDEARRIMSDLRPALLDDLGLIATIGSLCQSFQAVHSEIFIEQTMAVEEVEIPEPLKIVIYRVMQEAFHNIAKYSGAEFVEISLQKKDQTLEFTIEDNGEGFDLEAALSRENREKGLGLTSMRERVELSEGSFHIESTLGEGTSIRASWKLAARSDADSLEDAADRGHRPEPLLPAADILEGVVPEKAARLVHELEIHQVELKVQNEELRRAKEDLTASQEKYLTLFEKAPVGIISLDAHGLIHETNPAGYALLGIEPIPWRPRSFYSSVAAEDRDLFHLYLQNVFRTREPQRCTLRLKERDGTTRLVRLDSLLAGDETGGCSIYVTDLSECRTPEQRQGLLRELVERSPVPMAVTNLHGEVEYLNGKFVETFGYPHEEIPTLKEWALRAYPQEAYRREVSEFWKREVKRGIREGAEVGPVVFRIVCRDGSPREVEIRASVIGGKLFTIFGDITEQIRLMEALRESEQELRHLSSKLLMVQEEERAVIARELHDGISQSLSAIKYGVEHALTRREEDQIRALEAVVPLIQGAIEDVRAIYMGLRPSMLEDFGIVATLEWLCKEYQAIYPGLEIEQNLELEEWEIPEDLKLVVFRIAQQALENVGRHSQATYAVLSLRKEAGRITLSVEDEGVGFEVQGISGMGNPCPGIGLATMRERVELSGGTFSVESIPGEGTILRASWPYQGG